jgi:hypothetical protein
MTGDIFNFDENYDPIAALYEDPVTSGGFSLSSGGIKGLGMLGSAVGSYMQGVEQQQAAEYNAALVRQQGIIEQRQLDKSEVGLLSTQKAMFAKAGVTQSGSPLDTALSSAAGFELDKQIAKYNTQSRANMIEWEGEQAKKSGEFGAILQGAEGLAMLAFL